MYRKHKILILSALILTIFFLTSVLLAAHPGHNRPISKLNRAPEFMIPFERHTGPRAPSNPEVSLNSTTWPSPTNSPGSIIGMTYYDYQHIGAMGRQIAGSANTDWIIMTWMAQDDATIPGDRYIAFNAYNPATGEYAYSPPGLNATGDVYAGYTSCGWSPYTADTVVASFVCHVDPGTGIYETRYYRDNTPDFPYIGFETMIAYPHPSYDPETIWPIMETHDGDNPGVTEDVLYILTRELNGNEMILYRNIGEGVLDQSVHLETMTNISYTIVADPNSDNVVIVYTDDFLESYEDSGGQVNMDVYYMLSTDQFTTWEAPVSLSTYWDWGCLLRAYSDLSAIITPDGHLHVVAAVRHLGPEFYPVGHKCQLIHWDVDLTTGNFSYGSVIDEALYDVQLDPDSPCDPGAWNLYIAKPSISYCDGKLYALYTKFGGNSPNDCSSAGFANGELFLAASDDNGLGWDTPWNITQTSSVMCDSSECESDHWSSMARFGRVHGDETIKDTLDILYINDKDAGGIPHGEGTWCANNVMHYRFECRDVVHAPRISVAPHNCAGVEYSPILNPLHVRPDEQLTVGIEYRNMGNDTLEIYDIIATDSTGPNPDWIHIGVYMTHVESGDFNIVEIVLNYDLSLAATDPASYNATIEISHNAVNESSPLTIPLTLIVASDFNLPHRDSLVTGCDKNLMFYSTGRLGGNHEEYALNIPGDCDSVDTPPDELMYLYDASPMIAWNDGNETFAYTTIFDQSFLDDGTFRPQSEINWYSTAEYEQYVCTVSTTDSVFGVAIDLYAPTVEPHCFVIGAYTFFNWNPVKTADEVYVGFLLDWDIPSDHYVDNGSGYDSANNTIWQYGADYDSLTQDNMYACGGSPIVETDRLGGIAVFEGPAPAGPVPVRNAWTEANTRFQTNTGHDLVYERGDEDPPIQFDIGDDNDYIYGQMNGLSGYYPYTGDSLVDLHTGLTFDVVDMTAGAEYRYVVGLITTNEGEEDYLNQVEQARQWAVVNGIVEDIECDCIPGDPNADEQVNVADAVFVVNYVFKGGPAPIPYQTCSGDANCDCSCNVGDAVYVINYIFKAGDPPCSCEDWLLACGLPLRK